MFARVDHIGVAVEDLDAAIALHEEAYGMAVAHREVVEEQGVEAVLLDVGENHVELLRPLDSETPVGRFLSKRGPGLHHLCFEVEGLERTLAALQAAGVRLIDAAPRQGAHGRRIAFVHPESCGGVLIELSERG